MYAPEQANKKYRDDAEFSHAFFPVPVISGPEASNIPETSNIKIPRHIMCIGSFLVWNHTGQRHVNTLLPRGGIFRSGQHTSLHDMRSSDNRKFDEMILSHAGLLPKITAIEHFRSQTFQASGINENSQLIVQQNPDTRVTQDFIENSPCLGKRLCYD